MGYLLPGTVVSVLGSHVKVRLDDNREVIVPKECMSYYCSGNILSLTTSGKLKYY